MFKDLTNQKESKILEGHLRSDHVHMLISIPPKYAVSQVGRRKNFTGQHFWARGYYVSTVGHDEATIREYIKNQEKEDHRIDQLSMFQE